MLNSLDGLGIGYWQKVCKDSDVWSPIIYLYSYEDKIIDS